MTTNLDYLDVLGKNIRQARHALGSTKEQFAELMDVSSRTVSYWEDGLYPPTLDRFILLCDVLEQKPDNLLQL